MGEFSLEGTVYASGEESNKIPNRAMPEDGDMTKQIIKEPVDSKNLIHKDAKEGEVKEGEGEVKETKEGEGEVKKFEGVSKEEFNEYHFGKKDVPDGKDAEKDVKEVKKVDYKYDFPKDVELDCDIMDKFNELAAKDNLSKEQAQGYVNLVSQMVLNDVERNKKLIEKRVVSWVNETKADSEIGGSNLNEAVAVANKAIEKFGGNEFRKFIALTGIGNNKEVIRVFYRIGKAISEDEFITSNKQAVPKKDAKDVNVNQWGQPMLVYPSMEKTK